MDIHLIDEFRRRTNASYDEARSYLERYNGELLEAIIAFEKDRTGYRSQQTYQPRTGGFLSGLARAIQALFDIKLVITDKNMKTFHVPVIIPVILFPVWYVLFLMVLVMLIMGFRFNFIRESDPNVNIESIFNKLKNKMNENRRSDRGV